VADFGQILSNVYKDCTLLIKIIPLLLYKIFHSLLQRQLKHFISGNSPASDFYVPTFWNTLVDLSS